MGLTVFRTPRDIRFVTPPNTGGQMFHPQMEFPPLVPSTGVSNNTKIRSSKCTDVFNWVHQHLGSLNDISTLPIELPYDAYVNGECAAPSDHARPQPTTGSTVFAFKLFDGDGANTVMPSSGIDTLAIEMKSNTVLTAEESMFCLVLSNAGAGRPPMCMQGVEQSLSCVVVHYGYDGSIVTSNV